MRVFDPPCNLVIFRTTNLAKRFQFKKLNNLPFCYLIVKVVLKTYFNVLITQPVT